MEKPKYTEQSIQDALHSKYVSNSRFVVPNMFLFKWESDYFVLKDNGYCYEIEIKISRADFKNDEKKVDKHSILKTGQYWHTASEFVQVNGVYQRDENNRIAVDKTHKWKEAPRPNKFFYIVPAGMVSVQEIPSYAGLMYIEENGTITNIKEAPFLHKQVMNFDKELCLKFYYYWTNERMKRRILERQIAYDKQQLEEAK